VSVGGGRKMKYTFEIQKTYIYVKITGKISLLGGRSWEEIKNAFADVVMQTQKNKIYKILVDCRDFSGKISLLDRFLLAVFLVKENSKLLARRMHPLKTSFVLSKSLIDPRRFGETVARNRGLYGLVTDNMEEALDWLEQDTPPEKES
jgi:hypothetical protein